MLVDLYNYFNYSLKLKPETNSFTISQYLIKVKSNKTTIN